MMERLARRARPESWTDESDERLDPASSATDSSTEARYVEVVSGASVQRLPLAGLRVHEARSVVASILHVDPEAATLVNSAEVGSDYRLAPGDSLEFVHHAGEKGARASED